MKTFSFSHPFQEFLLQSRATQLQHVPEFMRMSFASLDQKTTGFNEIKKFGQRHNAQPVGLLATDIHKQFTEQPLPKLPF